ncbi:hypothetical protein WDN63_020715, partial [Acinetobacter baumannii]
MDKCREEFEQNPKTKELLSDSIYFDEKENRYKVNADGCLISVVFLNGRWEVWQEQQAKVEELKATIKGNHGRIAELERLNRVKAQAIIDLHQEITELKASHHGEVIGHEVHFKKIKQERDELQTLYTQQGINMLKLQKQVDAALKKLDKRRDELWSKWKWQADMQDQGAANAFEEAYWILEQALKG